MKHFIEYKKKLFEKTTPHFGILVLVVISGYGLRAIFKLDAWARSSRIVSNQFRVVSPLSGLPPSFLCSDVWLDVTKIGFAVSAVSWILQLGTPWSCWATVLCFFLNISFCLEQVGSHFHTTHLATATFIVLAMWYSFYSSDIRRALREKQFLSRALYPGWVSFLCTFCVAYFYFLSGWNKIRLSGFEWVNGLSLQLWTLAFGDLGTFVTNFVIEHRTAAWVLQLGTLILEVGAIFGIFNSKLRFLLGGGLIGFHIGQIFMFGWDFYGNLLLLILFFLPVQEWMNQRFQDHAPLPSGLKE